jgi:hypothetical protein
LEISAIYTPNGSSDNSDIESTLLFIVVTSVLGLGDANPCADKSKLAFCGSADMFSTTSTASSLYFRRYDMTCGSFSFNAM